MNFIKTIQTTSSWSITPELAAKMLATSVKNRDLRQSWVKSLAASMRRGEWLLSPQGIAFNTAGHLIDGHHRLNAVVRSGVTVQMSVTLGVATAAMLVLDQGVGRTIADVLELDKRVAQPMRLAASIAFNENKPTPKQVETLVATPLHGILQGLNGCCGTINKYFSSAPMRLAACICVMQGHDETFIFEQYRALVLMDYERLTPASQSLMRQATIGGRGAVQASLTSDTLARGMRIFDPSNQHLLKIQVTAEHATAANAQVRATLLDALKGGKP